MTLRMWVPSLASLSGLRIHCCCGYDVARIWPLARELPYATGAALKRKKKNSPSWLHSPSLFKPLKIAKDKIRWEKINSDGKDFYPVLSVPWIKLHRDKDEKILSKPKCPDPILCAVKEDVIIECEILSPSGP